MVDRRGCFSGLGQALAILLLPCGALLTLLGFLSFDARTLPFLMIGFALLGLAWMAALTAYHAERTHHDEDD